MNTPCVITIASNKGGVAKTVSSSSIGYILSKKNRVLFIDTDPQGDMSKLFALPSTKGYGKLGELLDYVVGVTESFDEEEDISEVSSREIKLDDYVVPYNESKNIDILAGGRAIKRLYTEMYLANVNLANMAFSKITEAAKKSGKYDYIIIDTAPSFDMAMNGIIAASDMLLIPIEQTSTSIRGANDAIGFLKGAVEATGKNIDFKIFFSRDYVKSEAMSSIRSALNNVSWKDKIMQTTIPDNRKAVDESVNAREPLPKKFPVSKAAKAYVKLTKELVM